MKFMLPIVILMLGAPLNAKEFRSLELCPGNAALGDVGSGLVPLVATAALCVLLSALVAAVAFLGLRGSRGRGGDLRCGFGRFRSGGRSRLCLVRVGLGLVLGARNGAEGQEAAVEPSPERLRELIRRLEEEREQ